MEPIDYRNETWESLQGRLSGIRLAVWDAWKKHGPGTTREMAQKAGIDILTFRPRTTELYQMGFVELLEERNGETAKRRMGEDASTLQPFNASTSHEGRYRAVSWLEAMQRFHQKKREATERQMQLI